MARYLLMNKNTPVLEFDYDLEVHAVMKILEVHDARYAPPSTVDQKGNVTKKALNAWWKGRAIPASRNQIQQVLDCLDLDSTLALAEKNFGLSLSDRYWINDTAAPQQWKDINFFDNNFTDDLGILTLGQQSSGHPNLMSPNSTLGGDLNKKWKIVNGERILLKTGSALFRQEVQNEVAATVLHQQLLEKEDYVPYFLHQEGRSTYSACKNMLGENEELITAYDVLCNKKKPSSMNDYQFLLSVYQELGLKNAEEMLTKMFVCDYILANEDRHWRNFGVIRNVETLEYTRVAPIFDSGTCLWCRAEMLELPSDYSYVAKPFGNNGMSPDRQLELFHQFDWFDEQKLDGTVDKIMEILRTNENISEKRLRNMQSGLENNIENICEYTRREK